MKLTLEEPIKNSGLRKAYIANELGVSADTLTNWIKNRSMIPLDKAVKLANVLRCKLEELYVEE